MNERTKPTGPGADPAANGASAAAGAATGLATGSAGAAVDGPPAPRPDATGPIGAVPLGKAGAARAAGSTSVSVDTPEDGPAPSAPSRSADHAAVPAGGHPTAPVTNRPVVRPRAAGPLTRMGPWAPAAGALVGAVLGAVATVFLAGTADQFRERLSLVFLVVGLGLLGASATLLADEVRLSRWRAREAAVRPAAWIDTTAGLLNGLTPARLLLLVAGFVLFLAAWTSIG